MEFETHSASKMLDHGWILCMPASCELVEPLADCIHRRLSRESSQEFARTVAGIWRRDERERRVVAGLTGEGFMLFAGWDISSMSDGDQYYVTWSRRFADTHVRTTRLNGGRAQIWVKTEGGVDTREVVDRMTKERFYVAQSKDTGPDHGSYAMAQDAVWTTGATSFECFLGGRVHLMACQP